MSEDSCVSLEMQTIKCPTANLLGRRGGGGSREEGKGWRWGVWEGGGGKQGGQWSGRTEGR